MKRGLSRRWQRALPILASAGVIAPPIFTVFFFGIFSKRLNANGCLAALGVGFALGVLRLAVDTPVSLGLSGFEQGYTPGSLLWIMNNIYFQYYSLLIFVASVVVMFAVSYATERPKETQIAGLTYATVTSADRRATRASWDRWDVVASTFVLVLIAAAYAYFRG